jgi:hypothetical protein
LKAVYPEHEWKGYNSLLLQSATGKRIFKSQSELLKTLEILFPNTTLEQNYRIYPEASEQNKEDQLAFYEFDVRLENSIGDSITTL